jgi:hypothetical protein
MLTRNVVTLWIFMRTHHLFTKLCSQSRCVRSREWFFHMATILLVGHRSVSPG